MKERPILFSAPMVRALLDGTKTQTRRIMKPQPIPNEYKPGKHWWSCNKVQMMVDVEDKLQNSIEWEGFCADMCPYGKIGDRLWVREAFAYGLCTKEPYAYRATHKPSDLEEGWDDKIKWTPSIHMPRIASRITLELAGVKVERLQDISEADAKAEGVERHADDGVDYYGPLHNGHVCPKYAFARLWECINGFDSWSANPWVWAISFKRVTP
jgi:hypothetical protein